MLVLHSVLELQFVRIWIRQSNDRIDRLERVSRALRSSKTRPAIPLINSFQRLETFLTLALHNLRRQWPNVCRMFTPVRQDVGLIPYNLIIQMDVN